MAIVKIGSSLIYKIVQLFQRFALHTYQGTMIIVDTRFLGSHFALRILVRLVSARRYPHMIPRLCFLGSVAVCLASCVNTAVRRAAHCDDNDVRSEASSASLPLLEIPSNHSSLPTHRHSTT